MRGTILVDGRGGVFWQIEPASGYVGEVNHIDYDPYGKWVGVANGKVEATADTEAEAALLLVRRIVRGPIKWTLRSVRSGGPLTLS